MCKLLTRSLARLAVLDSTGKPGAGLLRGNFKLPGLVAQCESISASNTANDNGFNGKYARVRLELTGDTSACSPAALAWDVCVPSSCSSDDVHAVFSESKRARAQTMPWKFWRYLQSCIFIFLEFKLRNRSITLPVCRVDMLHENSEFDTPAYIVM